MDRQKRSAAPWLFGLAALLALLSPVIFLAVWVAAGDLEGIGVALLAGVADLVLAAIAAITATVLAVRRGVTRVRTVVHGHPQGRVGRHGRARRGAVAPRAPALRGAAGRVRRLRGRPRCRGRSPGARRRHGAGHRPLRAGPGRRRVPGHRDRARPVPVAPSSPPPSTAPPRRGRTPSGSRRVSPRPDGPGTPATRGRQAPPAPRPTRPAPSTRRPRGSPLPGPSTPRPPTPCAAPPPAGRATCATACAPDLPGANGLFAAPGRTKSPWIRGAPRRGRTRGTFGRRAHLMIMCNVPLAECRTGGAGDAAANGRFAASTRANSPLISRRRAPRQRTPPASRRARSARRPGRRRGGPGAAP